MVDRKGPIGNILDMSNAINNPRKRNVKEVCWHCGVRRVTQFNHLGQGVCTHCAIKARKNLKENHDA